MSKLKYFDGTNWKVVNGQITGDTLPIGAIVPYGSATAPTNWLVCDGSAVSRTTYAELFNAIGTSFGAGDGSTTFNLPNLKGRVAVGQDVSDSNFNDIGETGGSKYLQEHYHEYKYGQTAGGDGSGLAFSSTIGTQPNKAAITNVKGVLTGNAGNLQPYQVVCYIIKAKQSAGVVANVSKTYSTSEDDTYACSYVNDLQTYSTTEQRVGTWIDGKPIYRKVVDLGNLPNATTKNVVHNISNFGSLISCKGMAFRSNDNYYFPLPFSASNATNNIQVMATNQNVIIVTGIDRSNSTGFVVLEYTKTTD